MMLDLAALWQMEMDALVLEQGKEPDPDIWRWSPLDIVSFDAMLSVARELAISNRPVGERLRRIRFGEAGAGIGTKLYLAKNKYNLVEYGYEINPDYVARAKELDVSIEVRDLRAEPKPEWDIYDIVYTARPFKDDDEEVAWEQEVQDAMRPGAVLIAAYVARKPYSWGCYYRRPFRGVWVKPVQERLSCSSFP